MSSKKTKFYDDGIRFECQGSGKCCSSRGEYGYVYLNHFEAENIAEYLKLSTTKFLEEFCEVHDDTLYLLKVDKNKDCRFLEKNKCSIYKHRPTQCKTWPFWPENMNAKTWKKEIVSFCPGVNQGPIRTKKYIEDQLEEQKRSENLI